MSAFTGTGPLIRLVLRRDRIKLPLWIAGIALMLGMSAGTNVEMYGSQAERVAYATATAPSMVSRIIGGPSSGTSIGSIIMLETFIVVVILAAFMSTLAIIRHTRQNEETGRSELIGSTVTGRHAPLMAAFLVVATADIITGVLCTLILAGILGQDSLGGAVAYGAAVAGTGMFFAGVAAITAQVAESARAANGLAAAAIGVAFLIRSVGDALGELSANGLEVTSHWLSWLSPLGWGFLMRPFVDDKIWPIALFGLFALLSMWAAVLMADRRDVGAGMIATKKGPARAKRSLLSPLGLAWRLQRGVFIGWAVTMSIVGVGFGVSGKEFENFFTENDQLADALASIGAANLVDGLFGALLTYIGVMTVGYTVQALLRLRTEESGSLEALLATGVSRPRWMLSHVTVGFVGSITLLCIAGLLTAIAYGLAIGDIGAQFFDIIRGTLVQIPAILVMGGFVALMFALFSRFSIALGWGGFIIALLIAQLGLMLDLPQWAMNISPFTHTPSVPAVAVNIVPLGIQAAVAAALTIGALAAFRRRNLSIS